MPPLNSIVKYAKNVRNCRSLKSLREMANAYIVRINRESTVPSTVSTMVFRYEVVICRKLWPKSISYAVTLHSSGKKEKPFLVMARSAVKDEI